MSLHEIVVPQTEPETEWVGGRALQKVNPTYWHAKLQGLIVHDLLDWLELVPCGRVASEWRFRVTPRGEVTRPLVPDVAFLSFDALPADAPRRLRYRSSHRRPPSKFYRPTTDVPMFKTRFAIWAPVARWSSSTRRATPRTARCARLARRALRQHVQPRGSTRVHT